MVLEEYFIDIPKSISLRKNWCFWQKNIDLDAGSEPCRSPEPQCPSTQRRSLTISKLFVQSTLRPRLDRPPQAPTASQRPLMSQLFRLELENFPRVASDESVHSQYDFLRSYVLLVYHSSDLGRLLQFELMRFATGRNIFNFFAE